MRRILIIALMLFVRLYADTMSLENFIDAALDNSGVINQAEADLKISKLSLQNERLSFLPDTKLEAETSFDDTGDKILGKSLSISEKISLFDDRFYSMKTAGLEKKVSNLNLEKSRRQIIVNVIEIYTDVLMLKKTISTYQSTYNLYEKEGIFLEEMLKSGRKTELDLYSVKIEKQNALLSIRKSERDLKLRCSELEVLTGIKPDLYDLVDFNYQIPENASEFVSEDNLDYLITKRQSELKRNYNNQFFKELIPVLSVSGIYQWIDKDYLKDEDKQFDLNGVYANPEYENENWTISLTLSYRLDSIFSYWNSYRSSTYSYRKSLIVLEDTAKELNKKVLEHTLNYELKKDELEIYKEKMELSIKKFSLAESRYNAGTVDFLDFRNAENERSSSEVDFTKARYEMIKAYIKLQDVRGEKLMGKY